MLGAGPTGQICPAFADQLERQTMPVCVRSNAEHGVKRSAYIKGRSIRMLCGLTRWRQFACGFRRRRVGRFSTAWIRTSHAATLSR
jgi:hypothetical protein